MFIEPLLKISYLLIIILYFMNASFAAVFCVGKKRAFVSTFAVNDSESILVKVGQVHLTCEKYVLGILFDSILVFRLLDVRCPSDKIESALKHKPIVHKCIRGGGFNARLVLSIDVTRDWLRVDERAMY